MTTSNPAEIVLPEDIANEVQKVVAQERVVSNSTDIRYLYHMYMIRWVAREFWSMTESEPNHPRKIDSIAKRRNLPDGWMPSSLQLSYDSIPFSFIEYYEFHKQFQNPIDRYAGVIPMNFDNGRVVRTYIYDS